MLPFNYGNLFGRARCQLCWSMITLTKSSPKKSKQLGADWFSSKWSALMTLQYHQIYSSRINFVNSFMFTSTLQYYVCRLHCDGIFFRTSQIHEHAFSVFYWCFWSFVHLFGVYLCAHEFCALDGDFTNHKIQCTWIWLVFKNIIFLASVYFWLFNGIKDFISRKKNIDQTGNKNYSDLIGKWGIFAREFLNVSIQINKKPWSEKESHATSHKRKSIGKKTCNAQGGLFGWKKPCNTFLSLKKTWKRVWEILGWRGKLVQTQIDGLVLLNNFLLWTLYSNFAQICCASPSQVLVEICGVNNRFTQW